MQVECRGNMFTMPRRRRFRPRIDCEAILGKLSSYFSLYHYIIILPPSLRGLRISTILPIPPFEKRGFVVGLSAYLTFKVSLLCIYLGALFKSIFFVRQISIMIGRKETIMRCEWFTSSVIFCKMEKNLLLLCGVCVASERCVRYELLDLTYKYSH